MLSSHLTNKELAEFTGKHWNEKDVLRGIEAVLESRKRKRAFVLRSRIQERLAQLEGSPTPRRTATVLAFKPLNAQRRRVSKWVAALYAGAGLIIGGAAQALGAHLLQAFWPLLKPTFGLLGLR